MERREREKARSFSGVRYRHRDPMGKKSRSTVKQVMDGVASFRAPLRGCGCNSFSTLRSGSVEVKQKAYRRRRRRRPSSSLTVVVVVCLRAGQTCPRTDVPWGGFPRALRGAPTDQAERGRFRLRAVCVAHVGPSRWQHGGTAVVAARRRPARPTSSSSRSTSSLAGWHARSVTGWLAGWQLPL